MMDCDTTGIEPELALVKYKKLVGGGDMQIVNGTVPEALRKLGYAPNDIADVLAYIKEHSTIEGAPHIKDEHLPVFDCAFQPANGTRSIHYMGHIRMMAAVQPFLSGAISKTTNVPADCTVDEIEKIYIDAWKMRLKAIAIYRDGCKRSQPLSTKKGLPDWDEAAARGTVAQFEELDRLREDVAAARKAMPGDAAALSLPEAIERMLENHGYDVACAEMDFAGYIALGSEYKKVLDKDPSQFEKVLEAARKVNASRSVGAEYRTAREAAIRDDVRRIVDALSPAAASTKKPDDIEQQFGDYDGDATITIGDRVYKMPVDVQDGIADAQEWANGCIEDAVRATVNVGSTPAPTTQDLSDALREHVKQRSGPPKANRNRLPDERQSVTHKFTIGSHEGYLTVGMYDDGQPGELFIRMAKEGSTLSGLLDSFATAVSLLLQHGAGLASICAKYKGTRFEPAGFTSHPNIRMATSISDYVARWLELRFMAHPAPGSQAARVAPGAEVKAGQMVAYIPEGPVVPATIRAATEVQTRWDEATSTTVGVVSAGYDAQVCAECGSFMVPNGSCHRCPNCGGTSGCS
jgi:hypothetical protein